MLTALEIIRRNGPCLDVWDHIHTQAEYKLPTQAINAIYKFVESEINRAVYSGAEEHVSNQLEEGARAYMHTRMRPGVKDDIIDHIFGEDMVWAVVGYGVAVSIQDQLEIAYGEE